LEDGVHHIMSFACLSVGLSSAGS